MYDMFDYLEWRGDLPFKKIGPNPVYMLIFSTLSYINFDGIVSENPNKIMPLKPPPPSAPPAWATAPGWPFCRAAWKSFSSIWTA